MGQKIIVQLVDDLDGTELTDGGETVQFALDGTAYEIDLSSEHAAQLREVTGKFVSAGRRVASTRRARVAGRRPATGSGAGGEGGVPASEIRAWAATTGRVVSERGRIPAEVREAYAAAH